MRKMPPSKPGEFEPHWPGGIDTDLLVLSSLRIQAKQHWTMREQSLTFEPKASGQLCSFSFSYYSAVLFNPQAFQRWSSEQAGPWVGHMSSPGTFLTLHEFMSQLRFSLLLFKQLGKCRGYYVASVLDLSLFSFLYNKSRLDDMNVNIREVIQSVFP